MDLLYMGVIAGLCVAAAYLLRNHGEYLSEIFLLAALVDIRHSLFLTS